MKALNFSLLISVLFLFGCASAPPVKVAYLETENAAVVTTTPVESDNFTLQLASTIPIDSLEPTVQLSLWVDADIVDLSCAVWAVSLKNSTQKGVGVPFPSEDGPPLVSIQLDVDALQMFADAPEISFELCGRKFTASDAQMRALRRFVARLLAALDALRG